jgi:hypothetical protein
VRENDAIPQLPGKEKNIDRIFDLLSISSNQKNHIKFKKKESVTAKQKVIESEKESDKEIIKDKEDAKEEENNNVNDNYKSLSLKKKRKKKKENDEGNYFSQYSSGSEKDSSLNREEEDTKRFDLDSNNINNYDNNNSTSLGSYRPNTMKKSKKIDKDKSVLKSPRSLKDVDTTTITDQIDENNQNLTTVLDSYLDCIDILPPPPLPEFPPLMFDENDEFIDKNLNRNNDGINNINNCENCVDLVIAVDMVKTDDGSLELDHEILENNENLRLEEHFQTFTKDSIVEGDGEDINTQTENNNILQSSSPDKFMELELGTETETKKKKIHYNQNYVDSSTVSLDSCQDQSSEKTTYSVQTTNSVQTSNSVDYTNPFQSFLPTIPSFRTSQSLMLIPAVNKKLKKFSSSLDVLHSLSFLCESKMLKSSQYIFFAETLLIYGISKFPTSADLWLFCAIFQIHFFKNLMNFGECLKNVNYSYPNIIQRWEVYFLFQDFERKGSGSYKTSKKFKSSSNPLLGEEEEDDVLSIDDADDDEQQSSLSIHSSMVFKSNISKALNHCTFAKTYLKRVYLMICKGI